MEITNTPNIDYAMKQMVTSVALSDESSKSEPDQYLRMLLIQILFGNEGKTLSPMEQAEMVSQHLSNSHSYSASAAPVAAAPVGNIVSTTA